MTTLIEVAKARQKQAGTGGQLITRLGSEVLDEAVGQTARRVATIGTRHAVRGGINQLQGNTPPPEPTPQNEAERYRTSRPVTVPVSPGELGLVLGTNVGASYLVPRALNRIPIKSLRQELPSIGHAATAMFGPEAVPATILANMLTNHMTSPISDPLYRAGKRTYWNSVGEGIAGSADQVQRAGHEARERYGVAGVPLQMFHGITNPVAGLTYAGRSLRDLLRSKQGSAIALVAEQRIHAAIDANQATGQPNRESRVL
jgi:hypothetical protein